MTVDATHRNWGLKVFVDGESILSIEPNCLSGRDLSEMDYWTIVMAVDHLLSYLESHPASIGTPAPSKIEKAYGLLWRYMGSVKEVHEARNILLSMIDRDGQRRGVQYAKENTAPVSELEALRVDDDPAPDPVKAAADDFDQQDYYYRDYDPDDSGDNPGEALRHVPLLCVSLVHSSTSGPSKFCFRAETLDQDDDEEETLCFDTQQEAIEAAKERDEALRALQ